MAKQVAEVVIPATSDDLPEGSANFYAGVSGADFKKSVDDLDDITEGTANKHFTDTEKTKLTGVEDSAKDDQTGAEMQTAIKGLAWDDREIVVTEPLSGEYKVRGIHRNAADNLEYDYDDVAEP